MQKEGFELYNTFCMKHDEAMEILAKVEQKSTFSEMTLVRSSIPQFPILISIQIIHNTCLLMYRSATSSWVPGSNWLIFSSSPFSGSANIPLFCGKYTGA